MSPEHYQRLYLGANFGERPRGSRERIDLPTRHWYLPRDRGEPTVGLADLFDTGVLCGHGETRSELARRVREADIDLAGFYQLRSHLMRRERDFEEYALAHQDHIRQLEHAVEAARAHARTYEESTFWRLSFPLRWCVHRLKLTARLMRRLGHWARLAPPRLSTARQILKDEGGSALFRRLMDKILDRGVVAGRLVPRGGLEKAIHALEVPASTEPRISVIVPTYGQDLHTFTCLKALAREAREVALEVIVMDDCAPQSAAQALSAVRGVRFERNERNLGFIGNCNRGASLARGEFLLFLNNDAILGEGALRALLEVFERHPDAGAVGAKLVYPDGRLQEAGGIVWRDGSAWNFGRDDDPGRPEYNYVREVDYCSGACLLVTRELFGRFGGFDARYAPAYYEDADFCFQIRTAGLKTYYQPLAEVVHFEGQSHGTLESEGIKRHQVDNRKTFYTKWHGTLASHRVNGVLPRLERDRGVQRRILLVEACMLTPDQDSGSLRSWRLLRVMRGLGCKVTFVADNLEHREPYATRMAQEGVEVVHYPHLASVEEYLEVCGQDFDVVILARYYVASGLIDAVRRHAPQAILVLDTIDLHFLRTRRLAELESSPSLARSAQAIYRQEMDCIRRVDVTWVVSPFEKEVLAREAPAAPVVVQTNIHEVVDRVAPFAGREGILFVGGFRHPPNVDAAIFYAREIIPHLRRLLPGVTTYFVGSHPPQAVLELAGEGLEIVGYVPELDPWFERTRVSVSPLRYGAGVKGKVNQSMSFGLPLVATSASIEGMHLTDGDEILVADEVQAFAEAVARLYRDEALWNRLSRSGIANVRAHFSPEAAARALELTFERAERRARAA